MGHKLQANLHHLLLQLQGSTKYDSICFMLQDSYHQQFNTSYNSNTGYNWSGLPDYVEELAAEWPEYSGFPSYPIKLAAEWPAYSSLPFYPIRPAPYITTYSGAREGFWAARRTGALWLGEYGAARQSLLDFLIERTKP